MKLTRRKALAIIPAAAVAPSLVPKTQKEGIGPPKGWCLVTILDTRGREIFPPKRIPNAPHASASWEHRGPIVKSFQWRVYIDAWPEPFDFPIDGTYGTSPVVIYGGNVTLQFHEEGVYSLSLS